MLRHAGIATAILAGGFVGSLAWAQEPTTPTLPPAIPREQAPLFPPVVTDPTHPDYHPGSHRTILRHNPIPKRTSYRSTGSQGGQGSAGYSNPGGVGRYAEYYTDNTLAPNVDRHANPVAGFNSGGGAPDRADQLAAQQVGNQRARNIQDHIDAYGRPIGFGYGIGLAGGFGYAYPY